jgi:hypothetical protein
VPANLAKWISNDTSYGLFPEQAASAVKLQIKSLMNGGSDIATDISAHRITTPAIQSRRETGTSGSINRAFLDSLAVVMSNVGIVTCHDDAAWTRGLPGPVAGNPISGGCSGTRGPGVRP